MQTQWKPTNDSCILYSNKCNLKKNVVISVTVMPFSIDKYNSFEFKNIFLEGDNK